MVCGVISAVVSLFFIRLFAVTDIIRKYKIKINQNQSESETETVPHLIILFEV